LHGRSCGPPGVRRSGIAPGDRLPCSSGCRHYISVGRGAHEPGLPRVHQRSGGNPLGALVRPNPKGPTDSCSGRVTGHRFSGGFRRPPPLPLPPRSRRLRSNPDLARGGRGRGWGARGTTAEAVACYTAPGRGVSRLHGAWPGCFPSTRRLPGVFPVYTAPGRGVSRLHGAWPGCSRPHGAWRGCLPSAGLCTPAPGCPHGPAGTERPTSYAPPRRLCTRSPRVHVAGRTGARRLTGISRTSPPPVPRGGA